MGSEDVKATMGVLVLRGVTFATVAALAAGVAVLTGGVCPATRDEVPAPK